MDDEALVDGVVTIPMPAQAGESDASRRTPLGTPGAVGDFVVGPENRLLEVVFHSVLGGHDDVYNPIVLYGPSGTGKSRLARGLADAWKSQHRRGTLYVSAVDFARQFSRALETHGLDEFRQRYQAALLLVVEDLGHLSTRPSIQEELLRTLDAQLEAGHRVVLTASVHPAELPGLIPALRSRLLSGLGVGLLPPGLEARQTILRQLLEERSLCMGSAALNILAEGLRGTVPELTAALAQLQVSAMAERLDRLDCDRVRRFLKERQEQRQPGVGDIALATARYFSLRVADLRSASRRQAVVRARGVAMYLARLLTQISLQQIGQYFGRRDHTTVLHACRKTELLAASEPAIHQAVLQLQQQFSPPM